MISRKYLNICENIHPVKCQQLKSELEKAELGRNEDNVMKFISWPCQVYWGRGGV